MRLALLLLASVPHLTDITCDPYPDDYPPTEESVPLCYGDPCTPSIGCGVEGLQCLANPTTDEWVCSAPCHSVTACDQVEMCAPLTSHCQLVDGEVYFCFPDEEEPTSSE